MQIVAQAEMPRLWKIPTLRNMFLKFLSTARQGAIKYKHPITLSAPTWEENCNINENLFERALIKIPVQVKWWAGGGGQRDANNVVN